MFCILCKYLSGLSSFYIDINYPKYTMMPGFLIDHLSFFGLDSYNLIAYKGYALSTIPSFKRFNKC